MLKTKLHLSKMKRHQRIVIGQASNKNDTRDFEQTYLDGKFYTKSKPKEAQGSNTRNATLAIRVITSLIQRMNTTSRESVGKIDERIDKLVDQLSTLVEIVSKKVVTPAPVKDVEEICVTCSGPHAWYNCPNTDNNQASVCAATGSYNQGNPLNRVSNQMTPPGFAPVQNNGQNRFNQNQGQGNNCKSRF
ncbi:hypothetical protein Tco_1447503 [Tanacetum coccineum]